MLHVMRREIKESTKHADIALFLFGEFRLHHIDKGISLPNINTRIPIGKSHSTSYISSTL
jgi:hypothetical protein